MKRFFTTLAVLAAVSLSSCLYDDTNIWKAFNELEKRVTALEELCRETNTNMGALEGIIDALTGESEVHNIAPIKSDNNIVGYTITFTNGETITLYNRNDRWEGIGGVPKIGVAQDSDGIYYWTLNNEWLCDADGNKIKAQGEDGITPRFKVEGDFWYVSYDGGINWEVAGSATTEVDSCDCQSIIQSVEYDDEFVYITLADSTLLVLARVQQPHECVDLGLSVKWATCNIGAYTPEGYGDYFAWGEIKPKEKYTWSTYPFWNDENGNGFVDYLESEILDDITGDPEYDAATANWGSEWRIPTLAELKELANNCTLEWTTQKGVLGMRFTAANGNSIFLPAAGHNNNTSVAMASKYGYYWSTTPYQLGDTYVFSLCFDEDATPSEYYSFRATGLPIRPVKR